MTKFVATIKIHRPRGRTTFYSGVLVRKSVVIECDHEHPTKDDALDCAIVMLDQREAVERTRERVSL